MRRRFLYYIPGMSGASEQVLQKLGLYDRFVEGGKLGGWIARAWNGGPDNNSGCLVATGNRPPEFAPESQHWLQVNAPGGSYWVSCEDTSLPPGPEDLVRDIGLEGYELHMSDGLGWRVPLIWKWDLQQCQHVPNLPQRLGRVQTPDGPKLRPTIISRYEYLNALAERIWTAYLKQEVMSLETVFEIAATILSANYKLSAAEVELLGLFDTATALSILRHATHQNFIERIADEMVAAGLLQCALKPDVDEMGGPVHG